jgi:CO/xanthine dehydrogenase Mo-binding subunit
MEPHVCVAHFDSEVLTLWSATQSPFPVRQELARVFGLPFSAVRVIVPYVGGGYGAKSGIKTEGIASAYPQCGRRSPGWRRRNFQDNLPAARQMTVKTGVKRRHVRRPPLRVFPTRPRFRLVTEKPATALMRIPALCADQRLFHLYQYAWRRVPRFRRPQVALI